jgi:UDP-glucose 6-dehydrogenase
MAAILICVPTPLDQHREPDLSFVRNTAETIASHLRRGQLVVLESTTLEIGTNSDGEARIEGLPDKLKKPPLEFRIRGGDLRKSVTQNPASDCHASFHVQLGKP